MGWFYKFMNSVSRGSSAFSAGPDGIQVTVADGLHVVV